MQLVCHVLTFDSSLGRPNDWVYEWLNEFIQYNIDFFIEPCAAVNLWAPLPTLGDPRATAADDNLSSSRQCVVSVLFSYFVAFFDD